VIFVTVGTHTLGFLRLVQAMDQLAATLGEDVVMQTGVTEYVPRHARSFAFATQSEMDQWCISARVVVAQAGIGSILTAQKARVPLILVPRQKRYGEHIDDHQFELAHKLNEIGSAIVVEDVGCLAEALELARGLTPAAPTHKGELILALQSILAQVEAGR
jgi:UDP-N-acetylglucosamine transferase subunit ALG13